MQSASQPEPGGTITTNGPFTRTIPGRWPWWQLGFWRSPHSAQSVRRVCPSEQVNTAMMPTHPEPGKRANAYPLTWIRNPENNISHSRRSASPRRECLRVMDAGELIRRTQWNSSVEGGCHVTDAYCCPYGARKRGRRQEYLHRVRRGRASADARRTGTTPLPFS